MCGSTVRRSINGIRPNLDATSVVSQRIDPFDGTIAENIARMAVEPNSEAVIEAARAAGAHDMIIKMPSGYDTLIGDSGVALSGGQQQRIAPRVRSMATRFLLS